ncbi:hypothetical protein ACQKO5_18580, partial [Novosphingobium subterraneum]
DLQASATASSWIRVVCPLRLIDRLAIKRLSQNSKHDGRHWPASRRAVPPIFTPEEGEKIGSPTSAGAAVRERPVPDPGQVRPSFEVPLQFL